MASGSPMTWNWNWKLVATGAAALTGALGIGAPLQRAGPSASPQTPNTSNATGQIAAVAELEEQTRRLDARLDAAQVAPPSRNPFRFGERPLARRVALPPPAVAPLPAVVAPAPFPLRLTGIAVDVVDGVEKRTAILSGPAGVELAAAGEPASPGYTVVEVGDSFAVVERATDGTRERQTLRP